nr:cleavage and polyadenylation specificity factor subunit 6-like [Delphinus delphis]
MAAGGADQKRSGNAAPKPVAGGRAGRRRGSGTSVELEERRQPGWARQPGRKSSLRSSRAPAGPARRLQRRVSSPRKLRVPQGLGCGPAGPGDGVGAALTPTRGAPGPGEEPARRSPTHKSPHGVGATEHRDPATSEPPSRRDPLHLRAPDPCDPRQFAVPDSPEPLSPHLGASDRPEPPPPLGPPGSSRPPCFSDPCSGAADAPFS